MLEHEKMAEKGHKSPQKPKHNKEGSNLHHILMSNLWKNMPTPKSSGRTLA